MKVTQDAVRIISERLGPEHFMVGYFMDALAKLYLDAGNLEAAESTSRQVLKIYEKTLPPHHLYVAATRHLLGEILLRRGQLTQAEASCARPWIST
jgi:ATP/maltotriose-dependent transcriptional regulator MalT